MSGGGKGDSIVTGFDDLYSFRFAHGRGYDKQSVELFRAMALDLADDLLREITSLQDRLEESGAASTEERSLLEAFRTLDADGRRRLLERLRPAPSPVVVPPSPAWLHGKPVSAPPPAPSSITVPPAILGDRPPTPEPLAAPSPVREAVASPIVVKAPPAPWLSAHEQTDARVLNFPAREPERPAAPVDAGLGDLFSRLDFGPPPADLLAAAANPEPPALAPVITLHAPIEVTEGYGLSAELPAPSPAFGGWFS